VNDETQLIYKGHTYSIDCLKMFSETSYITGGQDGHLSFWLKSKKKPISTFKNAHGGLSISSLNCVKYSSLLGFFFFFFFLF
jgi:ribosomal RNA-processing protein 9